MLDIDSTLITAIAGLITALASLIWAIRRKAGGERTD